MHVVVFYNLASSVSSILQVLQFLFTDHNERKSEQAHIPHALTLLENAVYDKRQFQALGTGNRKKRGYKLILKKINQHFL